MAGERNHTSCRRPPPMSGEKPSWTRSLLLRRDSTKAGSRLRGGSRGLQPQSEPPVKGTPPTAEHRPQKSAVVWNDTRLVRECLSGSEEAWSLLLDKYKALIYSVPVKYGLPPHEAAEVFQETCVELLLRLPDLQEACALPKWLIRVAYHQCCRWTRQSQRMISRDAHPDLPDWSCLVCSRAMRWKRTAY